MTTSGFRLTEKQKSLLPLLSGPARNVLLFGGSRSGKTLLFCYAIATRALRASGSRHGIFRKTSVAVKQSVGMDTLPKVLTLAYPQCGARYFEQDGMFEFPNGSEIWLAGLDDKDRVDKVLGKEFCTVYENEASEISYDAHTTLASRLAQKVAVTAGTGEFLPQKNYVDLNPTTESHWTHRLWVKGIEPLEKRPVNRADYVFGVANPRDNEENLDPAYIAALQTMPAAKRARFFEGRYTGDSSDALWTRAAIDNSRLWVRNDGELPDFRRVVVSIDPAISSNPGSNETGIIVSAIDGDGRGYVLADGSGVMKPNDWARAAVQLYRHYHADCIVAEANQGGEMVEATIRAVSPDVPIKLVKATRGKYVRAEPIAALYVRGRVAHVGELPELEDQMCSFSSGFDRNAAGYSPDRLDALVWGLTELFPELISDRLVQRTSQAVAYGNYDVFNATRDAERLNRMAVEADAYDIGRQQATAGMEYDPL